MFVITGYSNKHDGLLFVAREAKTKEEALKEFGDHYEDCAVVMAAEDPGDLQQPVLKINSYEEIDWESGTPRWAGWSLFIGEVADDGFASTDAISW